MDEMKVQGQITITLIKRNKDGVPIEKTVTYPDGSEVTEVLCQH